MNNKRIIPNQRRTAKVDLCLSGQWNPIIWITYCILIRVVFLDSFSKFSPTAPPGILVPGRYSCVLNQCMQSWWFAWLALRGGNSMHFLTVLGTKELAKEEVLIDLKRIRIGCQLETLCTTAVKTQYCSHCQNYTPFRSSCSTAQICNTF